VRTNHTGSHRKRFFEDNIDDEKFKGSIFGLGQSVKRKPIVPSGSVDKLTD
jgi:hypothetical protein